MVLVGKLSAWFDWTSYCWNVKNHEKSSKQTNLWEQSGMVLIGTLDLWDDVCEIGIHIILMIDMFCKYCICRGRSHGITRATCSHDGSQGQKIMGPNMGPWENVIMQLYVMKCRGIVCRVYTHNNGCEIISVCWLNYNYVINYRQNQQWL